MTPLVTYWVNSYSVAPFAVGTTNQVVMHMAADVEKMVGKWTALVNEYLSTKRQPHEFEDALRQVLQAMVSEKGNAETLQAELARVKGELENAKDTIHKCRQRLGFLGDKSFVNRIDNEVESVEEPKEA